MATQLDRMKSAFKSLMTRCKSHDATFIRDGQADVTLPVMKLAENDLANTGELKNLLKLTFYAIEGDADLVGISSLAMGDAISIDEGTQHSWTGEIIEATEVSITASFHFYDLPFTGTGE